MTSLARTDTRLGRAAARARVSFEENFMVFFEKDERKEMEQTKRCDDSAAQRVALGLASTSTRI